MQALSSDDVCVDAPDVLEAGSVRGLWDGGPGPAAVAAAGSAPGGVGTPVSGARRSWGPGVRPAVSGAGSRQLRIAICFTRRACSAGRPFSLSLTLFVNTDSSYTGMAVFQ